MQHSPTNPWCPTERQRRLFSERYLEMRLYGETGSGALADFCREIGVEIGTVRQWARRIHPALYAEVIAFETRRAEMLKVRAVRRQGRRVGWARRNDR